MNFDQDHINDPANANACYLSSDKIQELHNAITTVHNNMMEQQTQLNTNTTNQQRQIGPTAKGLLVAVDVFRGVVIVFR